jgi:hypothetical protein
MHGCVDSGHPREQDYQHHLNADDMLVNAQENRLLMDGLRDSFNNHEIRPSFRGLSCKLYYG